ncbi:formyltetrahydrofolate deformylase, partial [Thioclava sp. BHET1]
MTKYCLTVACSTRRGIVAAISAFLAGNGCNITDSSQFDDMLTGRFFMRVSFTSQEGADLAHLKAAFAGTAESFAMTAAFHDEAEKMKVVIMVSRFGHCLNDLLYRWRIGALPIDIVAVISN